MTQDSKLPLISIVVPTYNRKDYLRICLQALLNQSYTNNEIIVMDDGSTDDTCEMIKSEFPQVVYFYQENAGTAAAKNNAVTKAKGQYIVFIDSDDVFLPDAVEKLFKALPEESPAACSYGHYLTIDANGVQQPTKNKVKHFPSGMILKDLLEHIIVTNCGTMIPRQLFLETGGFDCRLRVAEDYKLFLTLAAQVPFYAVAEPIYLRRRHNNNLSSANYAKIKTVFSVFDGFVTSHSELQNQYPQIIRRRYADFHNKLYREAQKEGLRKEALEHITAACRFKSSFKNLLRFLMAKAEM